MLSIVTITARPDPKFQLMADSLAAAMPAQLIKWEWIVVDARLWYDGARRGVLAEVVRDRFPVQHVPPRENRWQGPSRNERFRADQPAQSLARNTGIVHARGDYVVFVDDCTYFSLYFLVAAEAARSGNHVILYPHAYVNHVPDKNSRPTLAPRDTEWSSNATRLRGSGAGYPLADLLAINGCDEAYCGQAREDVELGLRMMRYRGWQAWREDAPLDDNRRHFMVPHDAWIAEQKHDQENIFPEERFGTAENEGRTDHLMNGTRILPLGNDFDLRILRKELGRR